MGFAELGDVRLMSEVVRVRGSRADMQVFEDTRGLAVGDNVAFSGDLLSVELGLWARDEASVIRAAISVAPRVGRGSLPHWTAASTAWKGVVRARSAKESCLYPPDAAARQCGSPPRPTWNAAKTATHADTLPMKNS